MCRPSIIADDWVTKGCHIHVDGVELAVRPSHSPDYMDGVVLKKVFRSTQDDLFLAAAAKTREKCLMDREIRDRWRRSLAAAIVFCGSFQGEPATKANGRHFEFKMLIHHLNVFEERHGNA